MKDMKTHDARTPRRDLFAGFLKIGRLGFGGVAVSRYQVIVEERAWIDDKEFAELLGVASIVPGANTVDLAVLLGDRRRGLSGSLFAVAGLLAAPLMILVLFAILYDRFIMIPDVQNALAGAAAGLVIGTGAKMLRRRIPDALALASAAFVFATVGVFGVPLLWILLLLARATDHSLLALHLTIGAALMIFFTRANSLWGIASAAGVGALMGRIGLSF
jgi:chromate transporter